MNLTKIIDRNASRYDKHLCIGDFNSETSEVALRNFCDLYKLKDLVREQTCFKNTDNPSCIDLFLINCSRSVQDTQVIETGFSHSQIIHFQQKFSKPIQNLNCNKATQQYDIPIKILKENSEIFSYILCHNFNNSLFNKVFPSSLKKADITPVYKKDEKFLKNNYRPVSILPSVSKIYERCIYDQINDYFQPLFSKLQCGFRKKFNAQHCLLVLVEKCREVLDKRGYAGILLTDLSKAFDCINHELLIAKLHAYGFSLESLTFIQSYLTNRIRRVKINSLFSEYSNVESGVPRELIFGPIFFNIFICDLFFDDTNIDLGN